MRVLRGVLASLVVASTLVTGGAAITPADERECLPEGGYDATIEGENATLRATVHGSLLVDPLRPGALGAGVRARFDGRETLVFRSGVVFAGVEDPVAFVADPLSRFGLAFVAGVRPVGAESVVALDGSDRTDGAAVC